MENKFGINFDNPFMANAIEFNRTVGYDHDFMKDIIYRTMESSEYSMITKAQENILKHPTFTAEESKKHKKEYTKKIDKAFTESSTLSALGASPNAHAIVYLDNYTFGWTPDDYKARFIPQFLHGFPSINIELPTYIMTVVFFDRKAVKLFAEHMYNDILYVLTESFQYYKAVKFNDEFIELLDDSHHTLVSYNCNTSKVKAKADQVIGLSAVFDILEPDVLKVLRRMNRNFKPVKYDIERYNVRSATNRAMCNMVITKLMVLMEKLSAMCEDDRACSEHFQDYDPIMFGDARMSFAYFLANFRDIVRNLYDTDDINDGISELLNYSYCYSRDQNRKAFTKYDKHDESYMEYTFDKLFNITARDIVQVADKVFEYYAHDDVKLFDALPSMNRALDLHETTYKEFISE